jgi:hypothetical protein
MGDIGRATRRDVVLADGRDLDGLLGPLAAYLGALEARVGALEAQIAAVRLMTAADAAAYARVSVETILRAVRGGALPTAMSAARPGSLALPSTAVLPPARRRRPFPRSPAGVRCDGKRGC